MLSGLGKRLIVIVGAFACGVLPCLASTGARVTIGGAEQNINGAWEQGLPSITVNGRPVSFPQGQYSTAESLAAGLAAIMSEDANCVASAKAYGPTLMIWSRSGTNLSVAVNSTQSFTLSLQNENLAAVSLSSDNNPASPGQNVNFVASVPSGASGTVTFLDNGSALATVGLSGSSTAAFSTSGLAAGLHKITAFYNGDATYAPNSSTKLGQLITNPPPGYVSGAGIYNYVIGSFTPNGNVNSYADSVNGQWDALVYDGLSRLTSASALSGPWGGLTSCWSYDSFGNIKGHNTALRDTCSPSPTPVVDANNRSSITSYDSGGNAKYLFGDNGLVSDALYDAEGRLCATRQTYNGLVLMHEYLYDAQGDRVAKGTINSWSCDVTQNGFQLSASYVTGPNGQQVTEFDGTGNWVHSNAYAGRELIATYTNDGGGALGNSNVHFFLSDWLGTKRVQLSVIGVVENTWANQPFGDMCSNCGGGGDDEQHFTGKERDSESGLDYFGARYYASSMGRFMSPDPHNPIRIRQGSIAGGLPAQAANSSFLNFVENPQNWNKYAYVRNNPLGFTDPTGGFPASSDGHHLLVERGNIANPLGKDFANAIKTGGPNPPSNNWSNASGHPAYNNAVNEIENAMEQTEGDSDGWGVAQWKDFATRVLNSDRPEIKGFLDQIEVELPGSRAKLAAAISAYQPTKAVMERASAYAIGAGIAAAIRNTASELFICFTCNLTHYKVTSRIVPVD